MNSNLAILLSALCVLLTIVVFELTPLDLRLQDRFYDPVRGWRIDRSAPGPRRIFYELPKTILIAIVAGLVLCIVAPAAWSAYLPLAPREAAFLMTCIAVIPVIHWFIKRHTGVVYPCNVDRYGGTEPYRTFWESLPRVPGRVRGRGFPAAHSSGGFALMALYFVMPGPWRWLGLAIGLVAGWTVGMYQVLKGVHYVSHTVVTMFLTWTIILILTRAFGLAVGV